MRVDKVYSPFDETEFNCPLKFSGEWLLQSVILEDESRSGELTGAW